MIHTYIYGLQDRTIDVFLQFVTIKIPAYIQVYKLHNSLTHYVIGMIFQR